MQRIRGRLSVAVVRDSTDMILNTRPDTLSTPSASPVKHVTLSNPSAGRPHSPGQLSGQIDCTSPRRASRRVSRGTSTGPGPFSSCTAQPEVTSKASHEQSLASWLQPPPASNSTHRSRAPPSKRQRVRTRPDEDGDGAEILTLPTRAWAKLPNRLPSRESRGKPQKIRDKDKLSAWLEPRRLSGGKRRARDGQEATESPSHESPEKRGKYTDCESWMSTRLEGFDPAGAARAKDDWTDRGKRKLTVTDIALEAKRKAQGGRGWKTTPGGGKVFVAPSRGGSVVVATGQAAFRMSESGRKTRAF